jgi:Fe-S cluster assembly protein SufD
VNTALQLTTAEQALGISLPHRRMEEWRWTDLRARVNWNFRPLTEKASSNAVGEILSLSPFAKIAKARVAFVDGVFNKEHSNLAGLEIVTPATVTTSDPLIDMNTAMKPQGIALRFSGNAELLTEIIHITTLIGKRAVASAYRHSIDIAEGASTSIIETFYGYDGDLTNSVVTFNIGKNAKLTRLKYQNELEGSTHLSHVIYNLSEGSRLHDLSVTIGAGLTRQNGNCNFNGENAQANINGAYLLRGKQHADTRLVINHAAPNCVSRETFKCVMDDNARGIFQGKVVVAKHAQKTDGKQSSHALLLSENAEFDAKPELEIYADDVVCGHGATAGDLNEDHLFYLESRGIPKAEAKSLLIAAFVGEVFDAVENEEIREVLVGVAAEWLQRA